MLSAMEEDISLAGGLVSWVMVGQLRWENSVNFHDLFLKKILGIERSFMETVIHLITISS